MSILVTRGESMDTGDHPPIPADQNPTFTPNSISPDARAPGAVGASAEASPQSPLRIIVTGDTFHERYIWRDIDTAVASSLPYTWPDELRSARSTETVRELSGAPLHKSIFEVFLNEWGIKTGSKAGEISIEVTPGPSANVSEEDNPYAVYLHELGSFLRVGSSAQNEEYVWRIKQSFGCVHRAFLSPKAKANQRELVREAGARLQSISKDQCTPTVIVVNDRNAAGNGADSPTMHSRLRSLMQLRPADVEEVVRNFQSSVNHLLIIWHVRQPMLGRNPIAHILESNPDLARVTVPIVNYQCLREAGVPLRFDLSYESSIRTLLDHVEHSAVQKLLVFPHVIIRFDYGMFHLTIKQEKRNRVPRYSCIQ